MYITKLTKYVIVLYSYVNIKNIPCTRVSRAKIIRILRKISVFYVGGEIKLNINFYITDSNLKEK